MRPTDSSDGIASGQPDAESLSPEPEPRAVAAHESPEPETRTMEPATQTMDPVRRPARRRRLRLSASAAVLMPLERSWQRLRRVPAVVQRRGGGRRPEQIRATTDTGRSGDVAVATLARLTALPALLMVAWLVPGLPLLLAGSFLPVPMLLISVPLAAALIVNGLREVPVSWPRLGSAGRSDRSWTDWFGLLGTVAVVAGLTGWQLRESSQSLIVVRDAGVYLQTAYWIAQHGMLPISQQLAAFGGAHSGLSFASTGFASRAGGIYPAVTSGTPMLLAAGAWVHGLAGATAAGPILGGLAELSFAGLVARLIGPAWAPAGPLILGLSLPQQYISRSSLSETALQIALFGGLCLLADSLVVRSAERRGASGSAEAASASGRTAPAGAPRPDPGLRTRLLHWRLRLTSAEWANWLSPQHMLAGLAGVVLGFGLLVSLEGALYLLPLVPFAALLIIAHRPQASPFLTGCVIGIGYGAIGAFLLDRPFVDSVGSTVGLAAVVAVWVLALTIIGGQVSRLASVRQAVPRLLGRRPLRWLPEVGAVLAGAVLIGFAIRPYVQKVHGHPTLGITRFIAALQRVQGLPVDPTRLYSEQTLYWVIWYIGIPTVLLGGFGLVLLVRRCLRALLSWRDPEGWCRIWALPLAVICAGSVVVLWRPDIVPDQPWASRRLVVMVLPGLILFGLWAGSWLALRARSRGAHPATVAVIGVACSAAMLVPTVSTTFGLSITHSGKSGGLQPVAQGMALQQTGAGQLDAVTSLCAQIPSKASVVIIDRATTAQFSQVIRGVCGVPVGSMAGQPAAAVGRVLAAISAAGRRPVLLASSARALAVYGGNVTRVLDLSTTGDPHVLTELPTTPTQVRYVIWMTEPSGASLGT